MTELVTLRPQVGSAALTEDLVRLETCRTIDGISRLEATFQNRAAAADGGGDFVHFDSELEPGKRLSVSIDGNDVFAGIITAVHGRLHQFRSPEVMVQADDELMWMRMSQPARRYRDQSDSDIARKAAGEAGIGANASAEGPTHESFLQLHESDLSFLGDRARAVNARLAVKDGQLEFTARDEPDGGSVRLSYEDGTLLSLDVSADLAHQRTQVRVHGYSVDEKKGIHEMAEKGDMTVGAQGTTGPDYLERVGVKAIEDLHIEMPATREEAKKIAQSVGRRRARGFVRARGMTSGSPELRAGGQVEISGAGSWFSGSYLVVEVRQIWDSGQTGLRTHFTAERVGLAT